MQEEMLRGSVFSQRQSGGYCRQFYPTRRKYVFRVCLDSERSKDGSDVIHCRICRCRTISNKQTPVATDTFRLLTSPAMGNLAK